MSALRTLRRRVGEKPLALLAFLGLAALFYAPLLLGWRTFPDGDFTFHFLPFALFQREALHAGQLALWNPYTYAGHPFLADTQAAVFYPLSNLLFLLTWPVRSPAAALYWLQVEAVLHVALAGFFTWGLVRALTRNSAAAYLAGSAFALSGYLTGYPPLQLAVLRSAIWLPLLLWLLWLALAQPRAWRGWLAAALVYATAFLAGHPQTFFFLSQVVLGWLLLGLLLARPGTRLALLGRGAAFYALSLGLSTVQLWPSVEFTALSVRAEVGYEFLSGGFPPGDLWQFLQPGGVSLFSPLYVGIVPLALAGVALAQAGQRALTGRLRAVAVPLFFAAVALFFLLVSLGGDGPLYPLLYRWVPGWQLFRGQERAAYLVAFSLCVLAGYGAHFLQAWSPSIQQRVGLGLLLLLGLGSFLLFPRWQQMDRAGSDVALLSITRSGILALAFAVLFAHRRMARWRSVLLVALVVVDLFLVNGATNLAEGSPAQRTAERPEVLALRSAVAQHVSTVGESGRTYNEFRVPEDYGMLAHLEDVWGGSPLRLARYAALFEQFPLDRMWRLTGVEHVLTWRRELFEPSDLLAEFPQATDTTYLHRLREPNPRAWIVSGARVADNAEALTLLADHSFDLEQWATLPPASAARLTLPPDGHLAPPGDNDVRFQRLAPAHLLLTVTSERGGLLVISENWMPGWAAWLTEPSGSRRPVPVLRANLAFLAVPVPPGTTTVEVRYQPASVRYGLALSGLTLLLMGGVTLWRGRRRLP